MNSITTVTDRALTKEDLAFLRKCNGYLGSISAHWYPKGLEIKHHGRGDIPVGEAHFRASHTLRGRKGPDGYDLVEEREIVVQSGRAETYDRSGDKEHYVATSLDAGVLHTFLAVAKPGDRIEFRWQIGDHSETDLAKSIVKDSFYVTLVRGQATATRSPKRYEFLLDVRVCHIDKQFFPRMFTS